MVLYILGYILKFESAFLMLPALVSLLYQERAGIPFVITAAICLALGVVFTHKKPSSSTVYTREGFELDCYEYFRRHPLRVERRHSILCRRPV